MSVHDSLEQIRRLTTKIKELERELAASKDDLQWYKDFWRWHYAVSVAFEERALKERE